MKVVTFGEIMMRLAPQGYDRFVQSNKLDMTFGGGEANVCVSLANYGFETSFVTKVPAHDIGQCVVNELRRYGVGTSDIVRGGDRLGIYFCEKGASQRASNVIYDRANSAIAEAKSGDFDWNKIFNGVDWFHFTGITPALSDSAAELCLEACKAAKAANVMISADLNFRKKLWSQEKACKVMTELMSYVDVIIGNEEDADKVFGIKASNTNVEGGELNREGYIDVAKQLVDKFNCKYVAITLRESLSASDNNWSAMLYNAEKEEAIFSKKYKLHIVDRVGGGDSFGGGLIYGLLQNKGDKFAIEYAVAASALKHSIEGDFNHVSVDEVMKLAEGDGSGRVSR